MVAFDLVAIQGWNEGLGEMFEKYFLIGFFSPKNCFV